MKILSQSIIILASLMLFSSITFSQQPFSMTPNINGFTRIYASFDQLNGGNISYRISGTNNPWQTILVGDYDYNLKLNPFLSWDIKIRTSQYSPWSAIQTVDNSCTTNNNYVGYSTDFNNGALAACWRGFFIQNSPGFNGYSGSNISSTNNVRIESSDYSTQAAYLVSPKFEDLSSDKKIKFSLSYNTTNSNYPQQLKVGTMTNPYDPATFHLLQNVSATTTASQKTIYLNNYNGTDKYIAYKAVQTSGHFILDDFSYEQSVNCVDLTNINFTNIAENSAQLNFTGLNQTSWELYIKNLQTGQYQTTIINQNPFDIQNLIGNTNYEIKLRAICDVGLYSNWTSLINFATTCNSISAGYYTSFEETYFINPCWTQIKSNTSTITIPNYLPLNIPFQTGTRAIEMTAGYLDTTLSFVTPMISDISTNKRIRFSMIAGGEVFNDSNLLVGTMTDPTNPGTFTLLKTISFDEINDLKNTFVNCSWKEYIINLDNYSGNGNYIALKHSNTNSINDTFFIDDFYYENQPICVHPINQKATNTTYNEVTINWQQMSNVSASEFEIEYGITGFVQGAGTLVSATSSPLVISNLPFDDTIYDYYIRSKCGSDYSIWTKKQTFKTKCIGVSAGYTTNFTNETLANSFYYTGCWSRTTPYLPEVGYDAIDFVWPYSSSGVGNSACVIMHNQMPNQTNSMDKTILITPRLIDFNNYKKIKFKVRMNSNAGLITVGTLSTDNDYTTFTPYKDIVINQANSGVWTNYEVDFSDYYGADRFIGIKFGTKTVQIIYIDDFEYLENSCPKPTQLNAKQTAVLTETLSWTDNNNLGSTGSYEIEYGRKGFTTGTILTGISNTSYILAGLTEGVFYNYRVRANCTISDLSKWSEFYTFRTTCAKNAPFEENFDAMVPTNLNTNDTSCWTFNEGSRVLEYTILEGINSSPNIISIEKSVDYNSSLINTGLLISPYLPDFSANKKIKFWVAEETNNDTSVIIGTMSNPADIKTFTPYQTILLDNITISGREFEVNFNNYVGNNKHIAFLIDGNVTTNYDGKNIMLDDFQYLEINNCNEPLNIEDTNVTNNSALITWNQVPNQIYEIEYGIEGFPIGTGSTVLVNNTNSKLLTNLLDSSNYHYYIKTICSIRNSIVVGPKSFKTICAPVSLPWLEKFDSMTNYGFGIFPNCFKVPNLNNNLTSCKTITSIFNTTITGYDDTFYLRVDGNFNNLITPSFNLVAGTTYTLSMQAKKAYEYGGASLIVFAGLGNTIQSMTNYLNRNENIQTSFTKSKHYFTPIISGNYSFLVKYAHYTTGSVLDNFELKEGYTNVVNGDLTNTFDFNGTLSNDIILESTANSITQIIEDTATSGNKLVQMTGSNSNLNWNSFGNIWENNQNSISKINAKVNATNTSSLFMKFNLNQTYLNSSTDSKFRVLINGNVINEISATSFNRNSNSNNNVYEYNLTQYVGTNIRISLQHIGKNVGDDAFFDNLVFNNTASLSSNKFENNIIEYYPNPVQSILNIKSKNEIKKYEIYDINSRLISSETINKNEFEIDSYRFSSGIYFVKLFDSREISKDIKFIKK